MLIRGRRNETNVICLFLKNSNAIFLNPDRNKESPPTCLVPGAGLGRPSLEISCLGFVSQGNEFSYYMMICSSFILNQTQTVGEWTIYPWIHSNCNSLSDADQLRAVPVPDTHPARYLLAELLLGVLLMLLESLSIIEAISISFLFLIQ